MPRGFSKRKCTGIASFDNQDEVLFLVDLWGGTPFNQANMLFEEHKDKWAIVAGLNLPMLIEAYGGRLSMESAHEIAAYILNAGKEGVKVKPEELEPADTGKTSGAGAGQSRIVAMSFCEPRSCIGRLSS